MTWTKPTGEKIYMMYEAQGRRVEKRVRTLRERYVYVGYTCVQILNGDKNNELVKEFVWNPTEPVATRPLMFRYVPNNIKLFYAFDGNKNVSDVFCFAVQNGVPAHYEHAPFGAIMRTAKNTPFSLDFISLNPWRSSSEFYDPELDLVYFNFRHYSPALGRWLSRDPIEELGELNLYRFAYNSPNAFFDNLGGAPGDKRYGFPDAFWRWYHRQVKQQGDKDLTKEEADDLYDEWKKSGKPDGEGSRTEQEENTSQMAMCPGASSPSEEDALNWLQVSGLVALGVGIIILDIVTIPSGEGVCGIALITWALAN